MLPSHGTLPGTTLHGARWHRVRHISAGAAPLEQAAALLTKLITGSFSGMHQRTGEVHRKSFWFAATTQASRSIQGKRFNGYMSLPVEEYCVFDGELIRRIGNDLFELSVPMEMPGLVMRPTIRVHVRQEIRENLLHIESVQSDRQCIVVQCGVVQCGVVQCGVVQCGVVQCSVVQCGKVQCGVVHCRVVCACVYWRWLEERMRRVLEKTFGVQEWRVVDVIEEWSD